jgi:hypothetical protein
MIIEGPISSDDIIFDKYTKEPRDFTEGGRMFKIFYVGVKYSHLNIFCLQNHRGQPKAVWVDNIALETQLEHGGSH